MDLVEFQDTQEYLAIVAHQATLVYQAIVVLVSVDSQVHQAIQV